MRELEQLREELDRVHDYKLKAEDAVLAQRRRSRELDDVDAEERATRDSLPNFMKG
ncbi:hypothetical protein [Nocardioides aromaticivorans]|uniref:hypothetical protein n=1 Tax=Nocardioides aromaticivorans TaxID=200618 RepID=UPI001A8CC140|nr:hypothetical protein [Nocardioides aromaticivorans]